VLDKLAAEFKGEPAALWNGRKAMQMADRQAKENAINRLRLP